MPDQPQQSSGLGGTLKSKWGPLPVWGWLLVVTILALGYYLWSRRSSAQQQPTPATVGQPGVVVINQGATNLPGGTTPPTVAEDHDKDDKDKGKRHKHDDDDHHRHRKRHRHSGDDDDRKPLPVSPGMNPSGTLTAGAASVPMVTAHQPGPAEQPNIGAFFPTINPNATTSEDTGPSGMGVGR